MKKRIIIPAMVLLILLGTFLFADICATKEKKTAMNEIIRLHVRAADDTPEEQQLKLKIRDSILTHTEILLKGCTEKSEAREILASSLTKLEETGQQAAQKEGSRHSVTVTLGREAFEYREYDGFFLPEGEYDSLIITIGPGEGKNWWCVVFPAACTMGSAEKVETHEEKMPDCFQIAKSRNQNIKVEWWFWTKLKELFS